MTAPGGSMKPFDRRQRFCTYWLNAAEGLRRGAVAVWNDDSKFHGPVFRMLCGMAIEALIKGAIVGKGGTPARASHKLVDLAADAGLTISDTDTGLLRVLTHAIEWEGRYPAPKAKDEAAWNEFSSLWLDFCCDEHPLGPFTVARPNDALNWDGFDRLWQAASAVFWQHYNTELRRRADAEG